MLSASSIAVGACIAHRVRICWCSNATAEMHHDMPLHIAADQTRLPACPTCCSPAPKLATPHPPTALLACYVKDVRLHVWLL